ncbi:hypothetical protein PQX77_013125 [Marasmius sp. AFHP31]|nr:hypothetical protein PQX77_013125 [Marasmius sp. AFHP31]
MRSPEPSIADSNLRSSDFHLDLSTPLQYYPSHAAKLGDAALAIIGEGSEQREITEEEDRRVLKRVDRWLMPIVLLVYFLQQLDKSSLSYTSVFGVVGETVSVNVFMWGTVVACTAAAHEFKGLMAARFFLGLFEASVAPAFITITQMWWRRREQTVRLAMWMAMNGVTAMVGSLLSWGLGHISGSLKSYQTIFLFIGLLTVVCAPIVVYALFFLVLPDSPTKARFLSLDEKVIALERLRANNQGTESKVWKWDHVWEVLFDVKTYLWFSLLFLCCVPSGGISAFGPLIIQGFGFDETDPKSILFNIPFGFFQVVVTLLSALISTKVKLKWPIIFALTIPPVAGVTTLLKLGRDPEDRGALLSCYYVLSVFTGIQPMLYSWSAQNTAGHTKKLCTTGLVFVAQCAGNIVGPLLYRTDEKPRYHRGLVANLICWVTLAVMTGVTAVYLTYLNKRHEAARLRVGKIVKVVDRSLELYKARDKRRRGEAQNEQAFDDLTDLKNEDFIYVL